MNSLYCMALGGFMLAAAHIVAHGGTDDFNTSFYVFTALFCAWLGDNKIT